MGKYKLEVCIDSLESAREAVKGGATQLEVCSALSLGGLTPSIGLVRILRKEFPNVPLMVMLRCRGGDFVYSSEELKTLEEDIGELKKYASGFVFGFLTPSNHLDEVPCCHLVSLADSLPCTLHRAFDHVRDWKKTVDKAIECGFTSILTSGQKPTALEGSVLLADIVQYAAGRIEILVGSGVNEECLEELVKFTKAKAYHGSGSVFVPTNSQPPPFPMGSAESNEKRVTCRVRVERMVQILEQLFNK